MVDFPDGTILRPRRKQITSRLNPEVGEATQCVKTRLALKESAERLLEYIYKLHHFRSRDRRSREYLPTNCPALCFNMAAVDMSYVDIYNPKPAPKVSRSQPTRSVLNKHRPPLQPIKSPLAASRQNGQDNESSDDPFQSFDELFRYPNSRDAHQGSPQNHEPLHGSKHQLFDEGSLSIDLTISGLVYVLGSAEGTFCSLPLYQVAPY